MTFDPLKFYDDEQRKQKRYDSLLPVFLVAVVLLVAFYGFFVAYQRSHAKSVPVRQITATALATTAIDDKHYCVTLAEGLFSCGNVVTQWIRCDAGMEVTDYRDCPEFKTAAARAYTVLARKLYPQRMPKRKTDIYSLCRTNHGTVSQCRAEADYLAGKTPGTLTSGGITFASGSVPASRGWDTYDGEFMPSEPRSKPMYFFSDCDSNTSATSGPGYSYMVAKCLGVDVQLNWKETPETPETTPADITNLMEQIAPTANADIKLKPAPDCKMPADVDVCQIQMLGEKGKP